MVLRAAVALAACWPRARFGRTDERRNRAPLRCRQAFAFTCFEGSTGSGRIFNDGSVAGVVRMQGNGTTRFMHLPAGTLFPKGETVCSQVKGAFFNPCFELNKTSDRSFRGAVSGFGFAYCDFMRAAARRCRPRRHRSRPRRRAR